ncbi:MAG TPA: mechanosensitive ion channel [Candidatus Cloacimonadota bacterium]|nr:mechanosensitive ion channel [Candidatus Cloacimonadota bacterium]
MKNVFFINLLFLLLFLTSCVPESKQNVSPVPVTVDSLQQNVADSLTSDDSVRENRSEQILAVTGEKIKSTGNFLKTSKLFLSVFTFLLAWLMIHYLTKLLNLFSERWTKHRLMIKGIIPVMRIGGWTAILSFIIIGIIKPPIQSVLAITASAGIAIGFASQEILKNIFGGIVILFDKPFNVGDKIQMDNYYGEVINIGLRTVRVVTPDDSVVSIPNSEIISKSVSNANSGQPDCQVVAEFYFEPDLDMDRAHTLAIRCASLSRYVYLNKPIAAVFKNEIQMGKSLIKMRLKAYVFDHRYEYAFITDMSKIVLKEFEKAGLIDRRHLNP